MVNGQVRKRHCKQLEFGVENSPYKKVKPAYVYYYRQKFAEEEPERFPLRKEPSFAKGERRYKVHPEEIGIMELEEFVEKLNEKLPHESFYSKRARSFLIVLFYTPLRSSEVYERIIDNFTITKEKITIHLLRKKSIIKLGTGTNQFRYLGCFHLLIVTLFHGSSMKNGKLELQTKKVK